MQFFVLLFNVGSMHIVLPKAWVINVWYASLYVQRFMQALLCTHIYSVNKWIE